MEIKILCHCGTKYKFDVEPVDGRMPFTVRCPNCAVDATDFANAHIQRNLGGPPPIPAQAIPPQAPEPAPAIEKPRLRVSLAAHSPASAAPPLAPPVASASIVPPPPPVARPVAPASFAPPDEPGMGRFGLGVLGAFLGTLVGVAVYYGVFTLTGKKIKLLALGVGYLAGLGTQLLGKEGSKELGALTGVFVLAGLFGVQYAMGVDQFNRPIKAVTQGLAEMYDNRVALAKEVMKEVPNGTDDEIRAYLAKAEADEDEKPDPSQVTKEDIQSFRDSDWPEHRDFASGKISREQFTKDTRLDEIQNRIDETAKEFQSSPGYKMLLIAKSLTWFNLVCMASGVGLAYRMSTNA